MQGVCVRIAKALNALEDCPKTLPAISTWPLASTVAECAARGCRSNPASPKPEAAVAEPRCRRRASRRLRGQASFAGSKPVFLTGVGGAAAAARVLDRLPVLVRDRPE